MLAVIYLIYNEGYSGRIDLGAEAIRLGQVLVALLPDEPEAHGLLALMMIHHARRRARFAGDDLVLLDDQDRTLWDTCRSRPGGRNSTGRSCRAAGAPMSCRRRSRHCRPGTIDWPQVVELYRRLVDLTGSPEVELNLAVALARPATPRRH